MIQLCAPWESGWLGTTILHTKFPSRIINLWMYELTPRLFRNALEQTVPDILAESPMRYKGPKEIIW